MLVDAMRNCFLLLSVKDLTMKAKTHQSISAEIFFRFYSFFYSIEHKKMLSFDVEAEVPLVISRIRKKGKLFCVLSIFMVERSSSSMALKRGTTFSTRRALGLLVMLLYEGCCIFGLF